MNFFVDLHLNLISNEVLLWKTDITSTKLSKSIPLTISSEVFIKDLNKKSISCFETGFIANSGTESKSSGSIKPKD